MGRSTARPYSRSWPAPPPPPWPAPREPAVILTGALATAGGPLAWNAILRAAHASQFLTDPPAAATSQLARHRLGRVRPRHHDPPRPPARRGQPAGWSARRRSCRCPPPPTPWGPTPAAGPSPAAADARRWWSPPWHGLAPPGRVADRGGVGVAVGVDPDSEVANGRSRVSLRYRRPAWQAITQTTQPRDLQWQVSDRRYLFEGSMALLTATTTEVTPAQLMPGHRLPTLTLMAAGSYTTLRDVTQPRLNGSSKVDGLRVSGCSLRPYHPRLDPSGLTLGLLSSRSTAWWRARGARGDRRGRSISTSLGKGRSRCQRTCPRR
jgi:hypothetical protein